MCATHNYVSAREAEVKLAAGHWQFTAILQPNIHFFKYVAIVAGIIHHTGSTELVQPNLRNVQPKFNLSGHLVRPMHRWHIKNLIGYVIVYTSVLSP